MSLIVFVCGSNRSRSPMAAAYFSDLLRRAGVTDIEVCSAGLRVHHGDTVSWEAREALHRKGLEPLQVGTVQLLPKLVKKASLLLCMTGDQQAMAEEQLPSAKGKIRPLLSILGSPRPVSEPPKGNLQRHIECLEIMRPALEALVETVK